MLKFRYLFHNPDLAEMLIKNWDYDPESLELFKYFRISANAIYPTKLSGEKCYLRFSPVSEKLETNVEAELGFMNYLRSQGYPAMEAVRSLHGEELIRKVTPWGDYFVCVFRQVPGIQISQTSFEDEIIYAYGAALGELHTQSKKYEPEGYKRWTHDDVLDWIEVELTELDENQKPLKELLFVREQFAILPKDETLYGLIHYDFEPDNVFFDESNYRCHVIDFDDAMYHWYMMDIVRALHSIREEMNAEDISHQEAIFLEGYKQKCLLHEELLAHRELFGRFAKLYQYTRIRRAIQEKWENEPQWMVELRGKLTSLVEKMTADF